jgi:hypothetical protein
MNRRRLAGMVALLVSGLLAAGCSPKAQAVTRGIYAGSDSSNRAVTLEVGRQIRVNHVVLRVLPNGDFAQRTKAKVVVRRYRCRLQSHGDEVRCVVTTPAAKPSTETIELMRL